MRGSLSMAVSVVSRQLSVAIWLATIAHLLTYYLPAAGLGNTMIGKLRSYLGNRALRRGQRISIAPRCGPPKMSASPRAGFRFGHCCSKGMPCGISNVRRSNTRSDTRAAARCVCRYLADRSPALRTPDLSRGSSLSAARPAKETDHSPAGAAVVGDFKLRRAPIRRDQQLADQV